MSDPFTTPAPTQGNNTINISRKPIPRDHHLKMIDFVLTSNLHRRPTTSIQDKLQADMNANMIKLHTSQAIYGNNPTEEQKEELAELEQKAFESIRVYRVERRKEFDILKMTEFMVKAERGEDVVGDGSKEWATACGMLANMPKFKEPTSLESLARDDGFEKSVAGLGKHSIITILAQENESLQAFASLPPGSPKNSRVLNFNPKEDGDTVHELDRMRKQFGLDKYASSSRSTPESGCERSASERANCFSAHRQLDFLPLPPDDDTRKTPRASPEKKTLPHPSLTAPSLTNPPLNKTLEKESSSILPIGYVVNVKQGVIQDGEMSPSPRQRRVASLREKFEIINGSASESGIDSSAIGRRRWIYNLSY